MSNSSNRKQAIVIGGGIAGLTTCYRLVTESAKRGIPLDVKLLEAADRVGGRNSHINTGWLCHRTRSRRFHLYKTVGKGSVRRVGHRRSVPQHKFEGAA